MDNARPLDLRFDGDVVIVTGAGGGLGRAYALELARRGARVVVNDLGVGPDGRGSSPDAARATVDAIRAAGGIAEPNGDSVADPAGARAVVATALDCWGRLDAVVHNAGFSRDNYLDQLTDEELAAVMDVHLLGAFYLARPAYARMKETGGGRFVFTTSTAGLLGAPLMANYGAAKMGVVGLARSLALEGRPYGIVANALSPGALTRRGDDKNAFRYAARAEPLDPSTLPGTERFTPERVAPMVALLCHPSCPVTGEVLMARAGWFARAWVAAAPGWIAGPGEIQAEDLLEHWDEIAGAGRCADELPLDGPGWSVQFLNERIKPLTPSKNLETIHRLMNRSNFDDLTSERSDHAALEAYTDDFVVIEPPSLPHHGVHRGREQWLAMHEIMRAHWQQKLTVERVFDLPEDDVVVLYTSMEWTSKATGRTANWPTVQVFSFRDARICKVEIFHQDTKVILDTLEPA